MPISAQQWRIAVGQGNTSRSLRPHVTGQPKMKLTYWDVLLFIITALLGAILLSGDGGRGTGERKCVSRRSGGGGTVGELAPSLLTAPWRKQLLMLAGDIESNPGPYTRYGRLREYNLDTLVEEMSSVSTKWESIGRELFDSYDHQYLTDIHTSYSTSHDCMREMIRKWLEKYAKYVGGTAWRDIIFALRSTGESQLADNLKTKYIPDLLEESDLDLLTQELRPVQHKWESIGHELNPLSYDYFSSVADNIRCHHFDVDDCLRKMLNNQLQYQYATTTWRNIVGVLRSPDVGESQLADQLEAKYCPDLPSLSLVAQELTAVSEKWQYIGEEFGVEQFSLDDISTKYSDNGDRLREVLRWQFQGCATTWKHIVDVLRTPRIGVPHLANNLEAKYCSSAQQILQEALEKGYVDCHIWKVLVTGAAGSGKTSLKHRLFGEDPPSLQCSTALAEAAIRAISREIIGTNVTGWFRVTYEELMKMLGGALKAGVPMEKSPSGVTGVVAHKQPRKAYTTHEPKQPNIATAPGPTDRSPNQSIDATAAPLPVATSTISA